MEREARVDDVLDDQDVAAFDLLVQVLEQPDAAVAARADAGAVAGEIEEVELVPDRERARQVGEEDDARLQRRDEQRVTLAVVVRDLASELADPELDLRGGEVAVADAGIAGDQAS